MYAYMHIIPLMILAILSLVGTGVFWAMFFTGNSKWIYPAGACTVLTILLFWWWITAQNEPWRADYMSRHEIKEVVYPDGSRVQMFTIDGTHHNATTLFLKFIDEKEFEVERVRWSPIYSGVSYSGSGERLQHGDRYFLVKKKSSEGVEFKTKQQEEKDKNPPVVAK